MRYLPAAILLVVSSSAFADLVTNGDFETPTAGNISNYAAGGEPVGFAWSVGSSGSVDHIGGYWAGYDGTFAGSFGNQSLDLSGNSPGSIEQQLSTVAAQSYDITFAMSGNSDAATTPKSLNLQVGSTSGASDVLATQTITWDPTVVFGAGNESNHTSSNMGWVLYTVRFTATGSTSFLQFIGLQTAGDNAAVGAVVDGISVNETPEPATFLLFGAGIAGLGLWRRSQRRSRALRS